MDEVAHKAEVRRTEGMLNCLVLFLLASCGLYGMSLYSYLLFHTMVEIFCVFVTLGVFLLAWNSRRLLDNHYFLFLALSLITSSTLQLLHTFSYKGVGIFVGYDANLPTQFWIAFRYVFSLSFLTAPFFVTRKLRVGMTAGFFALTTMLLVVLVFTGNFPHCYLEGSGLTPFKIYSEYVIIVILAVAAALLIAKRQHFDSRVLKTLVFSIASAAAADAAFTRYVSVYGPANFIGHLFLFLSACLIYRAIVSTGLKEPAAILFRNLELSQQALTESKERLRLALDERIKELTEKQALNEALLKSNQRLDLLAASASRLLASAAPQQLVETLCREVMSYLDCDVFFNYLADEAAGNLRLNACAGIGAEQAARLERLNYGVAICGCAARDACRIVVENVPWSQDLRAELVRSLGIEAYACHPLISRGRVLGTLSFGTRHRKSFSEDDLSLMKAVADQVAIALERKLMAKKLVLAKQEAEAASRTKSRFLANMSHELRTPMTGVLGMLDLALQTPDPARQAEYLGTARKSARSLLRILNDILDLAKVEAGKFSLDGKAFRLGDCLNETVDILSPEARRKGISLTLEVADGVPELVLGDQVRLRQVLTNLIGNAVKFTDEGGVAVAVRPGEGLPGDLAEVLFSVADTGIGIPADKRQLLFEAFSQVDDSNTRSYGGTGLGLAISREIVARMGGEISVESEEGRGSTFRFGVRLPLAKEAEEAAPAGPATPAAGAALTDAGAGRRLLVAEDDATIRQVLGAMLERLKFRVDFAEDGRMAVDMWRDSGYDMIIMDVQMPRLDGFQATRAIREEEEPRGERIPILAMTAHAMKDDEKRCIDAGMDDYISKPIDFKECLDKIKVLLA